MGKSRMETVKTGQKGGTSESDAQGAKASAGKPEPSFHKG
jgi:hypothetical protein